LLRQRPAKVGSGMQFGARPLKRIIQDLVLHPLATKLFLGGFKPSDQIKVIACIAKTTLIVRAQVNRSC
jgi:ATP-dependent Clp protease ATP-binding subunit ClpA